MSSNQDLAFKLQSPDIYNLGVEIKNESKSKEKIQSLRLAEDSSKKNDKKSIIDPSWKDPLQVVGGVGLGISTIWLLTEVFRKEAQLKGIKIEGKQVKYHGGRNFYYQHNEYQNRYVTISRDGKVTPKAYQTSDNEPVLLNEKGFKYVKLSDSDAYVQIIDGEAKTFEFDGQPVIINEHTGRPSLKSDAKIGDKSVDDIVERRNYYSDDVYVQIIKGKAKTFAVKVKEITKKHKYTPRFTLPQTLYETKLVDKVVKITRSGELYYGEYSWKEIPFIRIVNGKAKTYKDKEGRTVYYSNRVSKRPYIIEGAEPKHVFLSKEGNVTEMTHDGKQVYFDYQRPYIKVGEFRKYIYCGTSSCIDLSLSENAKDLLNKSGIKVSSPEVKYYDFFYNGRRIIIPYIEATDGTKIAVRDFGVHGNEISIHTHSDKEPIRLEVSKDNGKGRKLDYFFTEGTGTITYTSYKTKVTVPFEEINRTIDANEARILEIEENLSNRYDGKIQVEGGISETRYESLVARKDADIKEVEIKKKSFALPGSLFIVSAATSLVASLSLSEGEQTAAQKLIEKLQKIMETYSQKTSYSR